MRGPQAPSRRSGGALGPRRRRRTENADGKGGKRTQEGGDSTEVAENVGRLAPRDLDLHLPGARGTRLGAKEGGGGRVVRRAAFSRGEVPSFCPREDARPEVWGLRPDEGGAGLGGRRAAKCCGEQRAQARCGRGAGASLHPGLVRGRAGFSSNDAGPLGSPPAKCKGEHSQAPQLPAPEQPRSPPHKVVRE